MLGFLMEGHNCTPGGGFLKELQYYKVKLILFCPMYRMLMDQNLMMTKGRCVHGYTVNIIRKSKIVATCMYNVMIESNMNPVIDQDKSYRE